MTKVSKVIMSLLSIVSVTSILSCAVLSSPNARDNQDPAKQAEMMVLVLEWGRLAPFPASATDVTIKTEGSSFTRSFRASFVAPKGDIEIWMNDSPGISEATPEVILDNKLHYVIEPGGGAQWAEVTIDFDSNNVEIYVYWS